MIVLLHVIIAFLSMGHATYVYRKPSPSQLRATYGLVGLTTLSGVYLAIAAPKRIPEACTIGLVYIAVVSFAIAGATHKLAVERATRKER